MVDEKISESPKSCAYGNYMTMDERLSKWTAYACAALYVNSPLTDDISKLFNEIENKAIIGDDLIDASTFVHHFYYVKQRNESRLNKYGFIGTIALLSGIVLFFRGDTGYVLLLLILIFIIVFLMTIADSNSDYEMAKQLIQKTSLDESDLPPLKPKYEKKALQAKNWICHNVVYHSGYSPFIGLGERIGGWSFTVNIDKPKIRFGDANTISPFQLGELYENVADEINKLNFSNLRIDNKVFISGNSIRDNKILMESYYGPLCTKIEENLLTEFIKHKRSDGRFYKIISIELDNFSGKLTALIRFYKNESVLYAEALFFALSLRVMDYNTFRNWKIFELHYQNIFSNLFFVAIGNFIKGIFYPLTLYGQISKRSLERKRKKEIERTIEAMPHYDYGAVESVNYIIRSDLQNFNQDQDFNMYMKIIEKRLLDNIESFLSSKGIDTKEFSERETNILNNGVMISGGSIEAQNLVVGNKATVKTGVKRKNEKENADK